MEKSIKRGKRRKFVGVWTVTTPAIVIIIAKMEDVATAIVSSNHAKKDQNRAYLIRTHTLQPKPTLAHFWSSQSKTGSSRPIQVCLLKGKLISVDIELPKAAMSMQTHSQHRPIIALFAGHMPRQCFANSHITGATNLSQQRLITGPIHTLGFFVVLFGEFWVKWLFLGIFNLRF